MSKQEVTKIVGFIPLAVYLKHNDKPEYVFGIADMELPMQFVERLSATQCLVNALGIGYTVIDTKELYVRQYVVPFSEVENLCTYQKEIDFDEHI